jgi:hypothetical protein
VIDTARNRELVGPHSTLVRRVLPASSAQVLHAMRTGTTLGRDGFLWVRPWRPAAPVDTAGHDASGD